MPESKLKTKNIKPKTAKTAVKAVKTAAKVVKPVAKAVKLSTAKSRPVEKETLRAEVKTTLKGGLKADVYDLHGKVVETIDLPKEIFGGKVNNQLVAQAVRVYLANQRRGTVSTKTRGEVQGSSAKIYRQKGTGRARHGSKRAPIFVHGGLVFGPKPRDYSLDLPKKMRRLALFSSLTLKNESGEIKVVKGLEKIEPKTKIAEEIVKKLGFDPKTRKVLLVTSDQVNGLENVFRAAENLKGVEILSANMLNAYKVLNNKNILIMKEAIEVIKSTFVKGGKN
jgi:large subunit ribosomal protein L4